MTFKAEDYVGDETLRRMQKTKWYAFAQFLEQFLYDGGVQDVPYSSDPKTTFKRFVSGERIFVSGVPEHIDILGRDKDYFETTKALRALAHECERMAMKEVT